MKKITLAVVFTISIIFTGLLAGCTSSPTALAETLSNQQEGIQVNGTGKVDAAPDIVILSLGIESQESTVVAAQAKAADAMSKVIDSLKQNGVAEKDIQTQQFSIQKVTQSDNNTGQEIFIGYKVINIVTVTIRNLDQTGTIIDSVTAAGGDLTRIDNINFSIEDATTFMEQAREKAMNDAYARAKQLASLSGVTLGKPTYITESMYFPVTSAQYTNGMAAPTTGVPETPINPGQLEISVNVQVTYSIQ